MDARDIFQFDDYQSYLQHRLEGIPGQRGGKSRLALQVQIKNSFLSRVLQRKAHLSLEQAEKANGYFEHSEEEAKYFLLLVQKTRAGTKSLERFFHQEMQTVLSARKAIKHRLKMANALTLEDRSIYYSSWQYASVHIALTIPRLRTRQALLEHFHFSKARLQKILAFLERTGLAVEEGGKLFPGKTLIHLERDSPEALKYHSAWRLRAAESLDREEEEHLHYSGVVSLAEEDLKKIRDILLGALDKSIHAIKESKEEKLYALCLDFFET